MDQTGGMGALSKKTKMNVDQELMEKEVSILTSTNVDLESLRPRISDAESYDKLIQAVEISTQRNESVAELQQRIADLGSGVIKVAKEAIDIARKV